MGKIELVYPQSPILDQPPMEDFQMIVKEGPYEEDLTDRDFHQQLRCITATLPEEIVFSAGAMNALMNPETRRMKKEAIDVIQTIDRVCADLGLRSFHCFGFQEFGRKRVTSKQATLRDKILVQRCSKFIALDSTPDSSNAPIEVRKRLSLGQSVIALFRSDNPRTEYREWFIEQVKGRPYTDPLSIIFTYDNLVDLAQGLSPILAPTFMQSRINRANYRARE